VIIHFTGKCKPWHLWGAGSLAELYTSYYQRSPWQTVPLDLPTHHKEMKRYAYILWLQKRYSLSLLWLIKYVKSKFFHVGTTQ